MDPGMDEQFLMAVPPGFRLDLFDQVKAQPNATCRRGDDELTQPVEGGIIRDVPYQCIPGARHEMNGPGVALSVIFKRLALRCEEVSLAQGRDLGSRLNARNGASNMPD